MTPWLARHVSAWRGPGSLLQSGVFWMLVTAFFFVCVHATGKFLLTSYPVVQVVWGRYAFHLLLAILVLAPHLKRIVRTADLKLQLLRSGLMLGASTFYFAGVQFLPLTEANAINFLTPILVVILAHPILGERVGFRRWIGVGIGFVGAMIVIRPGSGLMDVAAGILMMSAFCNACYQIATRKIGEVDGPLTTLLFTALVGTVASSMVVPFSWEPMDLEGWLLMIAIGGFALIGHFALIKAYRLAPAATIAPFSYSMLIWSALFGILIFDQLPDLWAILGALVIVIGGITILRAERKDKRMMSD
ncbi:MAG: DMT family transporter [Geminicoccaceae bacterium]|jgi:drug/metabolite transporter (DMT)-like permease